MFSFVPVPPLPFQLPPPSSLSLPQHPTAPVLLFSPSSSSSTYSSFVYSIRLSPHRPAPAPPAPRVPRAPASPAPHVYPAAHVPHAPVPHTPMLLMFLFLILLMFLMILFLLFLPLLLLLLFLLLFPFLTLLILWFLLCLLTIHLCILLLLFQLFFLFILLFSPIFSSISLTSLSWSSFSFSLGHNMSSDFISILSTKHRVYAVGARCARLPLATRLCPHPQIKLRPSCLLRWTLILQHVSCCCCRHLTVFSRCLQIAYMYINNAFKYFG